jgi:hypothetical protein
VRVVGSVLRVRCCSGGGPEQAPAMNPKKMARLWHNLRVPFTFRPSVEVGLGWIPQTLATFAPLQQATQLGARSQNSFLQDSLYCEISQQIAKLSGMAKRTPYKTITVERAKAAASKAKSARSAKKRTPNNAPRKG